jgi:hypothetical protein
MVALLLLLLFSLGTLLAWILLRSPSPRLTPPQESASFVAFYDEAQIGWQKVGTSEKESFSFDLVQQIDMDTEASGLGQVSFYITAEFNYAEFSFEQAGAEAFLTAMEKALPEFDGRKTREQIAESFRTRDGATIYVSPNYPDAGIFPKCRVLMVGANPLQQ